MVSVRTGIVGGEVRAGIVASERKTTANANPRLADRPHGAYRRDSCHAGGQGRHHVRVEFVGMHEVDVVGADDMEQPAEDNQIPVPVTIEVGAV